MLKKLVTLVFFLGCAQNIFGMRQRIKDVQDSSKARHKTNNPNPAPHINNNNINNNNNPFNRDDNRIEKKNDYQSNFPNDTTDEERQGILNRILENKNNNRNEIIENNRPTKIKFKKLGKKYQKKEFNEKDDKSSDDSSFEDDNN